MIYSKGFTLAEVLITLGVIGVVAAITLPNVINKYKEQETVSKVKKIYSTLLQAYNTNKALLEIELGATDNNDDIGATEVAKVFIPYLKILKDCGTTDNSCHYNGTYSFLNGSGSGFTSNTRRYSVVLQDGSLIMFSKTDKNAGGKYTPHIFYDVNGKNPPNTLGKDLFFFEIVDDTIKPQGIVGTRYYNYSCSFEGIGATACIILHNNMDYLHCDIKPYSKKTKCN